MGPKKEKRLTKKEKKVILHEDKKKDFEEKTNQILEELTAKFPGVKIDKDIIERVECMTSVSQLCREDKKQLSAKMLVNIKEDIFNNYLLQENCKLPDIQKTLRHQLRIMKRLKELLEADLKENKKTDYAVANSIFRDLQETTALLNEEIEIAKESRQDDANNGFFDFYQLRASTEEKISGNQRETIESQPMKCKGVRPKDSIGSESMSCTGARPKEKKNEHFAAKEERENERKAKKEERENERKTYIREYLERMSEKTAQAYGQTRHNFIWAVASKKFILVPFSYSSVFSFSILFTLIRLIPKSIASLMTGTQLNISIQLLTKMISSYSSHAEENVLTNIIMKLQWLVETFNNQFTLKTSPKISESENKVYMVLVESRNNCDVPNTQKSFCGLLDYVWDLLSELEEVKIMMQCAGELEHALRLEQEQPYMFTTDISRMKVNQKQTNITLTLQAELADSLSSTELIFLNLKSYTLNKVREGKGHRVYFIEKHNFSSITEIEDIFSHAPLPPNV